MIDRERFARAVDAVANTGREKRGIGTLSEKTLHAVLKHYYEPYSDSHEIKIGSHVADIVGENGIMEIQTRSFNRLRSKLDVLLPVTNVTIVYPIAKTKWLSWVDPVTGEATSKRKSPKQGRPYEAFFELYRIRQYLTNPSLRIFILMLDIEELRFLNGWSTDKKRGSSRCERIPVDIADEIRIMDVRDYGKLIPDSLPSEFTSIDYRLSTGLSSRMAQTALNVLNYVGAVERIGKTGRNYLYKRSGE